MTNCIRLNPTVGMAAVSVGNGVRDAWVCGFREIWIYVKNVVMKKARDMIRNIVKRIVDQKIISLKQEIRNSLTMEIKNIAKGICVDMVFKLLSEPNDTEWVDGALSSEPNDTGWVDGAVVVDRSDRVPSKYQLNQYRDTIVCTLKKGIKDMVLSEMTDREKAHVVEYIEGEEFIDSVVKRINRKQLI